MSAKKVKLVVLACVIPFFGLTGTAFSGEPSYKEDAAKIAQCMREIQARYHYFYRVGWTTSKYISWSNLTLCGNFETPYYPSDDWYELELRDAPDPAGRAKGLINEVFNCFRGISGTTDYFYGVGSRFVRQKFLDLEGKSVYPYRSHYDVYGSYVEGRLYGPEDIGEDFPELAYPSNVWISVTRDNYRIVLDALLKHIKELQVIDATTGLELAEYSCRYGYGFENKGGESCDYSEPVVSCWSTCQPHSGLSRCYGWSCPGNFWHEEGNWLGVCESIACYIAAPMCHYSGKDVVTGRFKVKADLRYYLSGNAKIFIKIRDPNSLTSDGSSFSNLDGLKAWENKWQQIGSASGGQEWTSRYFANIVPVITVVCNYPGVCVDQAKGWELLDKVASLRPDFEIETDAGIERSDLTGETIYKTRQTDIVYTRHPKCKNDPNQGEVIDMLIPCPWTDIITDPEQPAQSTDLAARVKVISEDTKDVAYVNVGGFDGRWGLETPDQIACVQKGPCSQCGPVLAYEDNGVTKYRLLLSVGGLMTSQPKNFQFQVQFWRQDGSLQEDDLVTKCKETIYAFKATPNHFACCAKNKCSKGGCYSDPFEFPEVERMKNNDVQVYFPSPREAYIFDTPRPGFIHDLNLESYQDSSHALLLKGCDGNPLSPALFNRVVLKYTDGIGYVYTVNPSWWAAWPPDREATIKAEPEYIIDSENYIIFQVNKQGTSTKLLTCDGDVYTEYIYGDSANPDRVTSYIEHDHLAASCGTQCREHIVTYDGDGRITRISNGGVGCQSCGGGDAGKIYVYGDDGNVLQEKDSEEVVLYEYDYDAQGRMIAKWLGAKTAGELVQEIIYTDSAAGSVVERHNYVNHTDYRVECDYLDRSGTLLQQIQYEQLNDNPDSPQGKFSVENYLHWPPSDDDLSLQAYWKLDETKGGWAIDSLVYDRDGQLRGYGSDAWTSNAVSGMALSFNGGQCIKIPNYNGVCGTQSRTVSAWIQTYMTSEQIIHWGSQESGQKWDMMVDSAGGLVLDIQGSSVSANGANLNNNAWHHIAVTFDDTISSPGNNITLYVDGAPCGSGCLNVQTSDANNVIIGAAFDGAAYSNYFMGAIDEVMIFDKALTPCQIGQLYAYQKRSATGTYTETTTVIPSLGKADGTGRRRESVCTYQKATDGSWYISGQTEKEYSSAAMPQEIVQSVSTYNPIYDAQGRFLTTRLVSSTTQGALTDYEYDVSYPTRVLTETQPQVTSGISMPLQLKRWYRYDSRGQIEEEREFTGNIPYNPTTDPYIVARHYQYDALGNLVKQWLIDSTNPSIELQVVEYKYNGFKQEICSRSSGNVVSGKEYNAAGQVVSEFVFADPLNWNLTPSQYAAALSMTTPEANRLQILSLTRYYYNTKGQLEFVRKAKTNNGAFAYCDESNPPAGVTWTKVENQYDDYGNRTDMLQYVNGLTLTTEYWYNQLGELEKTILPNKKYSKTFRDGRGLVKEEVVGYVDKTSHEEVLVSITKFSYDENGSLKEQTFPDGTRLENVYDEFDRIKKTYKGLVSIE